MDVTKSLPYRKVQMLNNTLIGLVVVFALVIACLSIAIFGMLPLKEVRYEFYEFDNATQNFVKVEKANARIRSNAALASMFLRRYVTDREVIDKATEADRYKRVRFMSSDDVWKAFVETYGKQDGLVRKPGFKRDIEILREQPLAAQVFQVEFRTTDYLEGKSEADRNYWVATMNFDFRDQKVAYEDRLLNPMGLFISNYSIARTRLKGFQPDDALTREKIRAADEADAAKGNTSAADGTGGEK